MKRRLLRLAIASALLVAALPERTDSQTTMTKAMLCAGMCSVQGADCLAKSSVDYCSGWFMGCMSSCMLF